MNPEVQHTQHCNSIAYLSDKTGLLDCLREHYRQLFHDCEREWDNYSQVELCPYSMQIGRRYNQKFLVVGRASNGWSGAVGIADRNDEYLKCANRFIEELGKDSLDWIDQQSGSAAQNYNTNRSAFWRMTRMLAAAFNSDGEDCLHHAAQTNLYKMAPDGGNPGSRLMDAQYAACVKILEVEIEILRPQVVVFLTGHNWAGPFLKEMGITTSESTASGSFVEFAARNKGIGYIVGQHPMGKAEQPHLDEILTAVGELS